MYFHIFCYFYVQQIQIEKKVGHWLSRHEQPSGEHDQTLKLLKTWDLLHVKTRETTVNRGNRFSISNSRAIGISCFEKPSLSVMYPDTDKATVILSDSNQYYDATFVKAFGKEYLAAACDEDDCLYL